MIPQDNSPPINIQTLSQITPAAKRRQTNSTHGRAKKSPHTYTSVTHTRTWCRRFFLERFSSASVRLTSTRHEQETNEKKKKISLSWIHKTSWIHHVKALNGGKELNRPMKTQHLGRLNSSTSKCELLHFRSLLCEPYTMQVRHTTLHKTDYVELFSNFPPAPGRLPALQQGQFNAEEQWDVNDVSQVFNDSVGSFNCVLCYRTHSSEGFGWRHAARSAAECWFLAKYRSHWLQNTASIGCKILLPVVGLLFFAGAGSQYAPTETNKPATGATVVVLCYLPPRSSAEVTSQSFSFSLI